jgi:hypothetical protein
MSGGGLVQYEGGDESGHSVEVRDTGPPIETIEDRVSDIRQIVADQKIENARGLKRGSLTAAKGGPKRLTSHDHRAGPPVGASDALSKHWTKLPAELRSDLRRLQDQHDAYASAWIKINPYADLCRQNGTNQAAVLADVHQLENLIDRDPVSAIQEMSRRKGWNPVTIMSEWLRRDVAVQQTPQSYRAAVPQQHSVQQHADQLVADFVCSGRYPRFQELALPMERLITLGYASDLPTAYAMAAQNSPQTARSQQAVSQARAAAKAVSGAPTSGTNQHVLAGLPANAGVRETIRAAINAQLGRS